MKLIFLLPLSLVLLFPITAPAQHNCNRCPKAKACSSNTATADSAEPVDLAFRKLPGVGKKVPIGSSHYFLYRFDKTPKLGTIVLKIQLCKNSGAKEKNFEIAGLAGLKGQEGYESQFKLNRLGEYLLPINFNRHGEWEIKLIFRHRGQEVFRGAFTIKV